MNTTSASLAEGTAAGRGTASPSRRTVDAPTRVFHGLLALCFAGAYATSDGERWRLVHVTLGYTAVGLLGFRVLWGLLGPRPARFSSWWRKLQALPTALRQMRQGQWPATLLQNLALTLTVVALMLAMALTTASGWATDAELGGTAVSDALSELHEWAGNSLLALVVAHIGVVIVLSLARGRNLATPMLTGRQPGQGPDLVPHPRGALAALLLAAVLAFWWQSWRDAPPNASPATPTLAHAGAAPLGGDDDDDDD